jgi:hypothetical protein
MEAKKMSKHWRRSPTIILIAALAGLLLVATTLAVPAGAAATTFTSVTVLDNDFVTDPTGANTSLRHNIPNLRVGIDGTFQDANFKDHYNGTGAADRWGLPTSEVFEEESGTLTQYYQRGTVDFHKRNDLGGIWVLERRLTWDYMGGGLGGSTDQGVEPGITNPNTGTALGPWGHKISNVDVTGKTTGFRDFFDRLGGVNSFGFPKTDAREDTGNVGTLLAPGSTPGITRQYFQAAVFESFPNNPPGYRVTLTLLGDQLRDQTYPNDTWIALVPFQGATALLNGQSYTVRRVEATPAATPTAVPTATAVGPTPTPTATPVPSVDTTKELIVIGTAGNGFSVFDGTTWRTVNVDNSDLGSDSINTLLVDGDNRIWVGTDDRLYRFDRDLTLSATFSTGMGSNNVTALAGTSPGGVMFIGHPDAGVSAYDPSQLIAATQDQYHRYRTDSSSLPSNAVRDLYLVDSNLNRVWIATQVGVAFFDGANDSWSILSTVDATNLPSLDVNAVSVSASVGTVWIGTNGAGIAYSPSGTAGTFTTATTANGLGSDTINEILIAADGTVWVATVGGLAKWGTLSFSNFNTGNSGLIDTNVKAVAEDAASMLWVATANGISRYDPNAPSGTGWTKYQTGEGLASNDTTAIVVVPAE